METNDSPLVRLSGFWDQGNFCLWNPKSWAYESVIYINLRNLESCVRRNLECSICTLESTGWDCRRLPCMGQNDVDDTFHILQMPLASRCQKHNAQAYQRLVCEQHMFLRNLCLASVTGQEDKKTKKVKKLLFESAANLADLYAR